MEKVRIGMRALGENDGSLGPQSIDVVVEVEPTMEGLQRMLVALYERYFDEDASRMVRAAVSGSSVQALDFTDTLEFLIVRTVDGIRAVAHSMPKLIGAANMEAELKKLDTALAKSVVTINAVEIGNAQRDWEAEKSALSLCLDNVLTTLREADDKNIDMHGPVKSAWACYKAQLEKTAEAFHAIPDPKYTVVDSASGAPVRAQA